MLDRKRPFAEVFGLGAVRYEQDGRYFLGNGNPAEAAPSEGMAILQGVVDSVEQSRPARIGKVSSDDMRLASNKALKVQMEAFGEEWQGVEHARRFLGIDP
jgi:hypothetical protein